jgi:hypothetical protein
MPEPATSADALNRKLLDELQRMGLTHASVGRAILLARARESNRVAQHLRERYKDMPRIEEIAAHIEAIAEHRRVLAEAWAQWIEKQGGK